MSFSIADLFSEHFEKKFDLHEQHLNNQMVRVLRTIGYDRNYKRAVGQYLYDENDNEYLDLLSGFGAFAIGRNHPTVISALQETLTMELPNLVQMDVSLLSGLLAERILQTTPDNLSKMFFCNSGTESVEAAITLRHQTGKNCFLRAQFPWLNLGLAILERRTNFPRRIRSPITGMSVGTIQ